MIPSKHTAASKKPISLLPCVLKNHCAEHIYHLYTTTANNKSVQTQSL